jgi:hypothetical protein
MMGSASLYSTTIDRKYWETKLTSAIENKNSIYLQSPVFTYKMCFGLQTIPLELDWNAEGRIYLFKNGSTILTLKPQITTL